MDHDDELTLLTELEADALIDMAFARDAQKANRSVVANMREREHVPMQNPSALAVYEDDASRRELFIADVGKRLTVNGTSHTTDYLRRTFRFTRGQAKAVLLEAKRELHARIQGETDLMRSVVIARLESVMRRAKDACDLSNEIRATKEWARVLGVYQTEEGGLGDLANVLRELSADQGPDPTQIIEAEFEDADDTARIEEWSAPEEYEEVEDFVPIPKGKK